MPQGEAESPRGEAESTVTQRPPGLEPLGRQLVLRVLDPGDRRVRRLELTPAGVELHARMMTAVIQLQTTLMAGLRRDEKEVMARCLDLIQANLEASGAPVPGDAS